MGVALSGPGTWIGGHNSGVRQSTFKPSAWTDAGINRVLVRSSTTAGTYTVTATRQGRPPARIMPAVDAVPVDTPSVLPKTGLSATLCSSGLSRLRSPTLTDVQRFYLWETS